MREYRKKPVVIVAEQYHSGIPMSNEFRSLFSEDVFFDDVGVLCIRTREGTMTANSGDWIIRGIKGEFYPCKPDIFDATYEPADATQPKESPND